MSSLRRRVSSAFLALSVAATLSACMAAERVTGPTGEVQLSDAQRSLVAQHLLVAAQPSGEGSIAATFAAAAIVGGAEVRSLSGGQVAAIAGSRVRANIAANTADAFYVVGVQITEAGSPDVSSVIVAWRNAVDGTPSDFILTLAAGSAEASFAATAQSAPGAFGAVYSAPSAWWSATTGSTSLKRSATGAPCRDISARLAAAGYRGTCNLAVFDGSLNIEASQRMELTGNTASGSRAFSLADAAIGGVVIEVTGVVAN